MSVNLHTACPRWLNVWRYSIGREQELKAQCQKVIEQERFPFVFNSLMKTMPLASKVFFCISFYYCLFRIDYNLCYIHL